MSNSGIEQNKGKFFVGKMKHHGQARGISVLRSSPRGLPVARNPAPKTIHPRVNPWSSGARINDYSERKGWFFGHFAGSDLLKSNLVEVAWQNISGKQSDSKDKHFHKKSVEINIVTHGAVTVDINGETHTIRKGNFYVIWPETIIENVKADKNTELIVVRAPSINDKVIF